MDGFGIEAIHVCAFRMKEFTVEEAKVLLVKDQGRFHAIGGKCTHYGAGLSKGTDQYDPCSRCVMREPFLAGAYSNGYVRCPWHGACFNVHTGDIEDFPGLDSVPCFQVNGPSRSRLMSANTMLLQVKVESGDVKLIATRKQLSESKRVRTMCRVNESLRKDEVVVIVGGGMHIPSHP